MIMTCPAHPQWAQQEFPTEAVVVETSQIVEVGTRHPEAEWPGSIYYYGGYPPAPFGKGYEQRMREEQERQLRRQLIPPPRPQLQTLVPVMDGPELPLSPEARKRKHAEHYGM